MSNVERRVFDRGFTHAYPRDRGLTEGISPDFGRIITENFPSGPALDLHRQLAKRHYPLFPIAELSQEYMLHSIPSDSRDLTDMIRLSRDSSKVSTLGFILGIRLKQMYDVVHQLPTDTVLPRFAVHAQALGSIAASGMDIKPLPPFDRYGLARNLNNTKELIQSDLNEMGEGIVVKRDAFMEGLLNGIDEIS